jgi:hypothetical protein
MAMDKEHGTQAVLFKQFAHERLPFLIGLQDRVDSREKLSDLDLTTMDEIISRAKGFAHLAELHPDLKPTIAKIINLYEDIMHKALNNERGQGLIDELRKGE